MLPWTDLDIFRTGDDILLSVKVLITSSSAENGLSNLKIIHTMHIYISSFNIKFQSLPFFTWTVTAYLSMLLTGNA